MPIISQEDRATLGSKLAKYKEMLTEYEQRLVREEEKVRGLGVRLKENETSLFSITVAQDTEGVEAEVTDIYVKLQEATRRVDEKMAEINA